MTVATVLKYGGIYTPLWVKRLRAGKHYTDPGPFMMFMDWLDVQARGTSPIEPGLLSAKLSEVRDLASPPIEPHDMDMRAEG